MLGSAACAGEGDWRSPNKSTCIPVRLQLLASWHHIVDLRAYQSAVRDDIAHNTAFLASPLYCESFLPIITTLITGSPSDIKVRNARLAHQVLSDPFSKELLGYPIGTAIYKGADDAWYEGAWPLWTHVVRHVDGCMGIAGGEVVEPVEGHERSYLVFVGWETVKKHEDYHHTEHFRKHFIILNIGHKGYTEYGHVVFQGVREKSSSRL